MAGKAIEGHFCEGIPIMQIRVLFWRDNVMAAGKNELQGSIEMWRLAVYKDAVVQLVAVPQQNK